MPRPLEDRNELDQLAITPDEEVRRNLESADGGIVGMGGGIKPIGEQVFDGVSPELPGRQADGMDHDQARRHAGRTLVLIGRDDLTRLGQPARIRLDRRRFVHSNQAAACGSARSGMSPRAAEQPLSG